jgi:hypothetical protein
VGRGDVCKIVEAQDGRYYAFGVRELIGTQFGTSYIAWVSLDDYLSIG